MKKRILSIILCAALIFTSVAVCASAVTVGSGLAALRAQWKRDVGPSVNGVKHEYSYFVPDCDPDKSCPLVVFLAGAGEGSSSGQELRANDFAYWSSEEYQARATGGNGMYLLIIKANEPVYFDSCPLEPLFQTVKSFVDKYDNIDRNRITVFGWCLGASGAKRLALAHPEFFSGLAFFSPMTSLNAEECETLKNTRIWLFSSYLDVYSFYPINNGATWRNLKRNTADKSNIRSTTSLIAPRVTYFLSHHTWRIAERDYEPSAQAQYIFLRTVDGSGKSVSPDGVIAFMTDRKGFTPDTPDEPDVPENPEIPTSTDAPEVSTDTDTPEVSTNTDAPEVTTSTDAPEVSTNTDAPVSTSTDAPEVSTGTDAPADTPPGTDAPASSGGGE